MECVQLHYQALSGQITKVKKSWWLFLVMLEGARRGVKIVFQHSELRRRFLFEGHTVLEGNKREFLRELQDPSVWYLCDGEAADAARARTFVAVSPEHAHYHKYKNMTGKIPRYNK